MKFFYKTKRSSERGMTLVEILFSMAIGVLVLGAVASILVMTAKTIHKNRLADDAANTTRKVQEHMEHYLSMAVSMSTAPLIRPVLTGSDGLTPAHYSRIDYRISAGPIASVPATGGVDKSLDTFDILCAPDLQPQVGDYLLCDYPALGVNKWGVQIIRVTDGRPANTAGTVQIQLAQTINNATAVNGSTPINMAKDTVVTVQRPQAYEAMDPGTNPVGELHFTPHTARPTEFVVLSKNVDAAGRYLFTQIPSDPAALEQSISWQFSYATAPEDVRATAGGNANFYQLNYTSGLIMPKTGNPLNLSGGLTHNNPPSTCTSTTSSTTSTSTTSISTTTSTSSISTTSTSSTSTSTTATTTTSTTATTTTSTTSTATSSTSTTATTTTSTTASTTTSSTTSISTTTSSTSTTSISTTSTTSTTSVITTTIEFDG